MSEKIKTSKQMERHFKGIANHRRIDILIFIAKNSGANLEDIADNLDCNIKTTSEHTRRLVQAGLVNKQNQGRAVSHTLSPYGKTLCAFITTFQHS
mgnify:CR=1 FL=1